MSPARSLQEKLQLCQVLDIQIQIRQVFSVKGLMGPCMGSGQWGGQVNDYSIIEKCVVGEHTKGISKHTQAIRDVPWQRCSSI